MIYRFGQFQLNQDKREIRSDKATLKVEPKVFDLILFLIENKDRVVSKDELIDMLWGGRFVSDAAVSSAVAAARKVLGESAKRPNFITTAHGRGFRFTGDVERSGASPAEADQAQDVRRSIETLPSIAVMPFENISADPTQGYFVDGVCEDIIAALGRIRWLFVIARNSTLSYKGRSVDHRDVARDLNVRYILIGSIQKAGDRVRISTQLLDASRPYQIWAEQFDRKLEDVFAVQDEIAESIAGALEPQLSLAENLKSLSKPKQTVNAWDCVIRAMALKSEFTDDSSLQALALLKEALEIDPHYSRAHSQIAWTIAWRIHQGFEDAETSIGAAIKSAEYAVQYDPNEPWAYIAWLFIATILRDEKMLLESPRKALEINPNFAMAHSWLGASLALTGRGEEAFAWIKKARQLSPMDIFKEEFDVHTSYAYFQTGDYENAVDFARKAMLPHPKHVYPRLISAAASGWLDNRPPEQHR